MKGACPLSCPLAVSRRLLSCCQQLSHWAASRLGHSSEDGAQTWSAPSDLLDRGTLSADPRNTCASLAGDPGQGQVFGQHPLVLRLHKVLYVRRHHGPETDQSHSKQSWGWGFTEWLPLGTVLLGAAGSATAGSTSDCSCPVDPCHPLAVVLLPPQPPSGCSHTPPPHPGTPASFPTRSPTRQRALALWPPVRPRLQVCRELTSSLIVWLVNRMRKAA